MKLTGLQIQALGFIADYQRREGAPPTRRELCSHMGWNTPATAQRMVDLLVRKGLLERVAERHGVIRLTLLGQSVLNQRELAA